MKNVHIDSNEDLARVLLENPYPGTVITLAPGFYSMPGNWDAGEVNRWCHVGAGVTLRGADPYRRSVLGFRRDPVLETKGVVRPDRDLSMLWCNGYPDRYRGQTDTTLENLTIDLRDAPKGWCASGLRMHNRSVLRNIRVLGVSGAQDDKTTLSKDVESFAVSATGNTGGSVWDGLSCGESKGYASGFFLGSTTEEETWSDVTSCRCDMPIEGWFGFAANQKVAFRYCRNSGGRVGFYNDWGKTEDVTLSGCDLTGSLAAILVRPRGPEFGFSVRAVDGSLSGETAVGVDVVDGEPVKGSIVVRGATIDAENLYVVRNKAASVRFELCEIRRREIGAMRFGGDAPKVTGCYGYDRINSIVK